MSEFFSSQNVSWIARLVLAQAVIFFLFLLGLINYSFPIAELPRPYFIVICIYFWMIYRPSLLSPAYIFILGLLFDFILNFPVGIHAVIFIVLQWVIRDQRLFFLGQPYMMVWMGFAFSCFGVFMLEWLSLSLISLNLFNFYDVLLGTLITVLIFPLVTLLFNVIYRILPSVSQSQIM